LAKRSEWNWRERKEGVFSYVTEKIKSDLALILYCGPSNSNVTIWHTSTNIIFLHS
jgi:hypothetical protein